MGPLQPGIILSLLIILRLLIIQILLSSLTYIVSNSTLQHGWTDATLNSTIIYECHMQSLELYVIPVTSIYIG